MTDNVTHRQKNKTTNELAEDVKKLADTNKGLQEKVTWNTIERCNWKNIYYRIYGERIVPK